MKNKLSKINIIKCDILFLVIYIILYILLSIRDMQFRPWFNIFLLVVFTILFAIGILINIMKVLNKECKKKKTLILAIVVEIALCAFLTLFSIVEVIFHKPEHDVELEDKRYVAIVSSFLRVEVNYYDYINPFIMSAKISVNGYFGKGGYDPIENPNTPKNVIYTYYNKDGKEIYQREEIFYKDDKGNITDKDVLTTDYTPSTDNSYSEKDKYMLAEDAEVLYEKKFGDTILRFGIMDYVLGQNMLVNVIRSKDNGENFFIIGQTIKVSLEAEFAFLTEELGFAISTGSVRLKDNIGGMYATQDGGKTFENAIFNYENPRISYMSIDSVPYYKNGDLLINCSIYDFNVNGDGYETVELLFKSNDNGLTWNLIN